jgi:hypothetical protein
MSKLFPESRTLTPASDGMFDCAWVIGMLYRFLLVLLR